MFEGFASGSIDTGEVAIHYRIGGSGPPLLLLHGYPQTHLMWHKIAPPLAERFTVVAPDLRGYGASSKPAGGGDHATYSKRAMAADQAAVMQALGFDRFAVVAHDRGARVTHRLCLDHAERVVRATLIDILPTATMYGLTDKAIATAYFHWFFLIQRADLPERLIGGDPDFWIDTLLGAWGRRSDFFAPEAVAEYKRAFRDPAAIHATCEDYRAAAGIDLEHDRADAEARVRCPLQILWGADSVVGRLPDPLGAWLDKAVDVTGGPLPGGHFLAEQSPQETLAAVRSFLDSYR
jgi:haloacetate dehalogenase